MILKDDNGKELPEAVQERVNNFIDWLKDVRWFAPQKGLKKSDIEKQAKFTLKCFWVEAEIEFRKLQKKEDWDSARDSTWDSTWDSAWDSARDSAWYSASDSALSYAWSSCSDSAWDSAWAVKEILLSDNKQFSKKYPDWAFKQLFKLWEMWLYPVGVLKENEKFVIYVPPYNTEFPGDMF